MHLLFVLFDFTIVFCFAWDDYVASFCNSPFFHIVYAAMAFCFSASLVLWRTTNRQMRWTDAVSTQLMG